MPCIIATSQVPIVVLRLRPARAACYCTFYLHHFASHTCSCHSCAQHSAKVASSTPVWDGVASMVAVSITALSAILLWDVWFQVLIEDAEFIMNRAAAGEVSWDDIRPQLAKKYEQAGLTDVAEFAYAVR